MMAQAAPLLLLLPILLMGSQGQVTQLKYQEGQTLRVICSYEPQTAENRWKAWCKVRENGKSCDRLITAKSFLTWELNDLRVSLKDDPSFGTITITMSNLKVKDSGIYLCGIYDSVNNIIYDTRTISLEISSATTLKTTKLSRPITETPLSTKHSQSTTETPLSTSATPLATSSPPHSSIFSSSLVIQVLCGLIVTKGLVFTALVVLLGRCRGPGKGRSQFEISQDQNDLK
ncbi:natural cytotoxicity triggering receptor 2-like [Trichosurus vulpecula]|uniref:natural cytotoxicity triggering receptor 2-like n=1 Tax=Trichosurus vulpecula TaxID=9337 RepID=UPI00186B4770|nr:natural cytotoxicity triggering receptor 2-like [Trichosurus vulpecula]